MDKKFRSTRNELLQTHSIKKDDLETNRLEWMNPRSPVNPYQPGL